MNKIINRVALSILLSSSLTPLVAYSQEAKPADYEKALMKYVLSYEALQKVKQDPERANELPKYYMKYKQTYSEYLKLLQDNELYNPADEESSNDPAGNYNRKQQKKGKSKQKWKKVDTSSPRKDLKSKLEQGLDLDSAIEETTSQYVPSKGISKSECEEAEEETSMELAIKEVNTGNDLESGDKITFDQPSNEEFEKRGYYPDERGMYPDIRGYYADENGNRPNERGYYPDRNGYLPNERGYYPNGNGDYPDERGYYPGESIPDAQPNENGEYPDKYGRYPRDGQYPDKDGRYPHGGYYPDKGGRYPRDGQYPDKDGRYPSEGKYPSKDGRYDW